MRTNRRKQIVARILCAAFCVLCLACSGAKNGGTDRSEGPAWASLEAVGEVPVRYATEFRITRYMDGYELIEIPATGRLLLVPEGMDAPKNLPSDVTVLFRPVGRIYLAATSAMDFFRALDGVGAVRLSGTKADGWSIDEAREAMERGEMLFAGKYSAPDYELILKERCDLAIESTMIYHTPAVSEKLQGYGIPVLIERSSYEQDPLGRMEWIKVYGALLGKEEAAIALFDAEVETVEAIGSMPKTGKTVAFFYVTGAGAVNVRKSDDYVVKMIEAAGGVYVFPDLDSGSALSTVNMTMESFYAGAKDADVLIYNSTIDGEIYSIDELLDKSPLFREFKAVQNGDVWCTGRNLFQEPTGIGTLIEDLYRVLSGEETGTLNYLHKLTNGGD
ncbi:MAG: ABC transporter substrate-binding protein [Clostridia bacterium]|nr:ABC transporter substrate-binding protein [Clostridia bacterium]